MHKECVLNELSILDFDKYRHDVLSLVQGVENLRHAAGATRLSIWQEVLGPEPETEMGRRIYERYSDMLRIGGTSGRVRDQWRQARKVFDRLNAFDANHSESATLNGNPAHGLDRAHKMRGLALSLDTEGRWDTSWLDLKPGSIPVERVRHAARTEHLAKHEDWAPLDDIERLRFLLESSNTVHKPASEYGSGKHVRGATNEERARIARKPGGAAQYLSHRGDERVTDDQIRRWEEDALSRVRSGAGACNVQPRGSGTYWVFCDLGEVVGYEGGTGEPITSVRVERSSGAVHSHPRRTPT